MDMYWGVAAMKKTISAFIIWVLFFAPAAGNADYVLHLKNGGQISTPGFWFQGELIFFYCPGGTAGMERRKIDSIEEYQAMNPLDVIQGPGASNAASKASSPLSTAVTTQKPAGTTGTAETGKAVDVAAPGEEKVDIEAYKSKKEEMTAELDAITARLREATAQKDEAAKQQAMEEMRKKSAQIYNLTDELTKKNKGKLPEGWWDRLP